MLDLNKLANDMYEAADVLDPFERLVWEEAIGAILQYAPMSDAPTG
jgi:hypothetical protein